MCNHIIIYFTYDFYFTVLFSFRFIPLLYALMYIPFKKTIYWEFSHNMDELYYSQPLPNIRYRVIIRVTICEFRKFIINQ